LRKQTARENSPRARDLAQDAHNGLPNVFIGKKPKSKSKRSPTEAAYEDVK
jgi:hypothetical protein